MEFSASAASAPLRPEVEPEPPGWQLRALWVNGRLLCGSVAFFFLAFVFAYFYLRSLDSSGEWKIGKVHPSVGLGTVVMVLFVLSAVALRLSAARREIRLGGALAALVLGLAAIAVQCVDYTTLDFGPASGGYASVFTGWTSLYLLVALIGLIWVEIQVASVWRARRVGFQRAVREGVPSPDPLLLDAGLDACSFYWTFFAAIGLITWVILYLV